MLLVVDVEYCNVNLHDIVTPIHVDKYQRYLLATDFDKTKAHFLVNGFKHGFDIGYKGPLKRRDLSKNIPIRIGSKLDMWTKLMKEVKLGRHAGPFKAIPYDSFMQLPIGLVPKAGGQTRLIFHLSFDFGKELEKKVLTFIHQMSGAQ